MLAEIMKKGQISFTNAMFQFQQYISHIEAHDDQIAERILKGGKDREMAMQMATLCIITKSLMNNHPKKEYIVSNDMVAMFANTKVDFENFSKLNIEVNPGTIIFIDGLTLYKYTKGDFSGHPPQPGDSFMFLYDKSAEGDWISIECLINENSLTSACQISTNPPGISLTYALRTMSVEMQNLMSNILLYITSHPDWIERVESSEKQPTKKMGKRRRKQLEIENQYRVIHKIGIPKQITKSIKAADFDEYGNPLKQYTINKRFMVRGHWRNQVCGKKNQNRKYVFIAPFWKGPEDAPLVDHIYKIK